MSVMSYFKSTVLLLFFTVWIKDQAVVNASRQRDRCPRRVIVIKSQSGILESPGYPRTYHSKQRCIWQIQVNEGFLVYLHFNKTFDVPQSPSGKCEKNWVLISSRRQSFRTGDTFVTGSHTVVFCGSSHPSNITSFGRNVWIRFHSDKTGQGKGFRLHFNAIDINECKIKKGGCERRCVNTPGSYRCACQSGFTLMSDGKHCAEIPRTRVFFNKKRYQATVTARMSSGAKLVKVRATAERTAKPLEYRIITINNRVQSKKRAVFAINRKTGVISLQKRPSVGLYRLLVEARLNEVSFARVNVNIRVRPRKVKLPSSRSFRFTNEHYSVIIPNTVLKGQKILQLGVKKPANLANETVRYKLRTKTQYFALRGKYGSLTVIKSLKPRGNVTIMLRVRAVIRGRVFREAEATISIVVVPEFIGNEFVESSLKVINSKSISAKKTSGGHYRSRSGKGMAEFRLHRMFRRPSPEARRISEADLKFNNVIKDIKLKVAKRVLGSDDRSRTDLVSVRLGPSSLASASKMSDIIRNINCTRPKVNCSDNQYHSRYRTFDGTCNNLNNPLWGAAPSPFSRMLDPVYYDDNRLSDPVGFPDQPFAPPISSPHLISREFFVHHVRASRSSRKYSHMLMQWGQFLDHDLTFTAESEGAEKCFLPNCDNSPQDFEPPCFPIMYPENNECTMFTRSAAACQSDDGNITPREQLNTVTSYIDGSQIYGSLAETANNLRDLISNRGYLRTSPTDFLPYMKSTLKPPLNLCQIFGGCFDAGDFRVNEQIALVAMHTLWVREHNRITQLLNSYNRHWDNDKIFHEARKIVGAELQHITYSEYLPKILGPDFLPRYKGYSNVNPTILNVFATAAFRFGHSTVRPSFSLLNSNFEPIASEIPLINAFFNNKLIQKYGVKPILLGLLANVSQDVDRRIATGLTKHLFQQPESEHGFDLAALNIQRGRDHGLPGYGVWRRECNLTHAEIFEETLDEIKDPEARRILDRLYNGSVESADLFVSGLAEEPVKGAIVGPTFHCILKEQFKRLRDGDRFWYENSEVFTNEQLAEIKKVTLSRVLCDNLVGLVSIQKDAFIAPTLRDKRVICSQLPSMNLRLWKEKRVDPPTLRPVELSRWFYTVRTPTGSWAIAIGKQICRNSVVDIQCQLADGSPLQQADQVVHCEPLVGVYCRNSEQRQGSPNQVCRDFRFRFLCSDIPRPVPAQPTEEPIKGFPSKPTLTCDARHPTDFVVSFVATESITIKKQYTSSSESEYLFVGKNTGEPKNRLLVKFDTRKVTRRAIVHSAFLFLYLVDIEHDAGFSGLEVPPNNLEVYQVLSSDWTADNTTSVIPWHENYLGIGTDVDARISLSAPLRPSQMNRWVTLDVAHALRNWQIRRQPNYGLMVKTRKETSAKAVYRFASSHNKNLNVRPRLMVCLKVPPW